MSFVRNLALLAVPFALVAPAPATAGVGDLLVAPTRVILDGRKGTELVLSNIGDEPATYRISVEFRRMTPDGSLVEVTDSTERDKLTEQMLVYQPRRVTLAPNEPQSIRIAARAPQGLADGEYRVHLLFRAVPPPIPVVPASATKTEQKGISFAIRPVYGVTIPVIVRLGNLSATAGIANVRLETYEDRPAIALDLSRKGDRSTFGEVRVLKSGIKDPIAVQRAVAVYTELESRKVLIPIEEKFAANAHGPVTVQYVETFDDGTHVLAETQAVLR